MKFTPFLLLLITVINLQYLVTASNEIKVGGELGWHVPNKNDTDFYSHWTKTQTFHVGDSLCFEFKNDSVLVVNKYGYYHCDMSNKTSTFDNGIAIIRLNRLGPVYVISGSMEHCLGGQRLEVDVVVPAPHQGVAPSSSHHAVEAPGPSVQAKSSGSRVVIGSYVLALIGGFMLFL